MISYEELSDIARRFGSPFYLFDQDAFIRNFRDFSAAFSRRDSRFIIGYSYKTNYIPYICQLVRGLGGFAEVVSRLELDLALKIGCPPAQVIFNGPVKSEEDIHLALSSGMVLNLDTFRELECVMAYARNYPRQKIRVGLRLNVVLIDETGKSHLQEGVAAGRFGFPAEAIAEAAQRLQQFPNLRVNSLHAHVSSTSRSLWAFRTIARTLAETGERYFPDSLDYLDIGGGFFGRRTPAMGLVDTPTYEDYAEAICAELKQHFWFSARRPCLIIEPGMALVADTMSFITRVFDVKTIGERRLAVVDGSFFNVKPTMHRRNHPFEIIRQNSRQNGGNKGIYSVVGATCMEKDCLLQNVECGEVEREDFFRIGNVGAYTLVLAPPFIHPAPAVVIRSARGYEAIRRRQEFNQFFDGYLMDDPKEVSCSMSC